MTDNQKNTLPKSWKLKTLGEVCEVLDNKRKPINSEERQNRIIGKSQDKLYPYYGSTGQVGFIDDYLIDGNFILLGEDGAPFLDSAKEKAYLISGKSWVNNHAHILKAKDKISSNIFVKHFLNILNYEGYVNGTTRLKLNQSSMKDIQIPLPPLPEQQRIVQKIESLFTELETGTKALKTALNQIKIYRQAVLNHFLSDESWEVGNLEDISEAISGYAFSSSYFKNEGKYQIIRMGNVRPDNLRLNEKSIFIDEIDDKIIDKVGLRKNDIIITLTGTRNKRDYGHVLRINNETNLLLNQRLAIIRFHNPTASFFYNYYLKMKDFQDQFFEYETGNVGQGNVGMKAIKEVLVPLPSLEIQTQIVTEIEKRMVSADALEASLKSQLIKAENLRQSILKRAFEGKLV